MTDHRRSPFWDMSLVVAWAADDQSDVDLLIDVPAGTGLIAVERMAEQLEAIVAWPVDVMTSGAARGRMAHVVDEAVAL